MEESTEAETRFDQPRIELDYLLKRQFRISGFVGAVVLATGFKNPLGLEGWTHAEYAAYPSAEVMMKNNVRRVIALHCFTVISNAGICYFRRAMGNVLTSAPSMSSR